MDITQLHMLEEGKFLTKWTIKYDETYGFPQFISGTMVDGMPHENSGATLITENIYMYDMLNKRAITECGEVINLIGPGNRMLIVPDGMFHSVEEPEEPEEYS